MDLFDDYLVSDDLPLDPWYVREHLLMFSSIHYLHGPPVSDPTGTTSSPPHTQKVDLSRTHKSTGDSDIRCSTPQTFPVTTFLPDGRQL